MVSNTGNRNSLKSADSVSMQDYNWKSEYEKWLRDAGEQMQSYGKDCEKLVLDPLRKIIDPNIPKKLYKLCRPDGYAAANLKNNVVGTTRASEFNDPYDTLQFLDRRWYEEGIRRENPIEMIGMRYKALYDTENFLEYYKDYGRKILENFVENVKKEGWTLEGFAYFAEHQEEYVKLLCKKSIEQLEQVLEGVRRETFVSCFTTDFRNMLMWSHYADSHKGFALGYDIKDVKNQMALDNLFPICYSDKKIDVTVETSFVQHNILNEDRKFSIDKLLGIKSSLFKSLDWTYENEWRLVVRDIDSKENWSSIPLTATEIYYGCRIDDETRDKLHAIAVAQRLREYQMEVDPFSMSYEMKYIEL